jgi:hypothetical protein
VSFKPGSREGVQKKTILVETNDPAAQNLNLEVRATVEMVLAISPAAIVFPPFAGSAGSAQPLYARISGSQSASTNITGVECSAKLISAEVNRSGFDGDPERQVKFSVLPGMPVGRFREQVVLATDNEKVPTLSLFVTGEVLGAISVTPRHLPLGTIQPGTPVRKIIRLQSAQPDLAFRVVNVKSTVEGLTTELITVTPGKEYQVAVGLAEGFSQPVIRGEIIITTDVKDQATIPVRVFGRISSGNMRSMPGQPLKPSNAPDMVQ